MTVISENNHQLSNESMHLNDDVPFEVIVRSIIISHAKIGATIQDIRDDYYEHTGEKFPIEDDIVGVLLNIPGIVCYKNENGTYIFNVAQATEKTQHILNMVRNQKPQRNKYQSQAQHKNSFSMSGESSRESCYFKDNYDYLRQRNQQYSNPPCAQLCDYQLLGDDFLLSVARMELRCRIAPGHRIVQSGLCVSGQTIADAKWRVETAGNLSENVIVNIGSVDILHGHDLMDIKHDFIELMNTFRNRGVHPILTTLAPLANYGHKTELRRTLERFNDFLRFNYLVIDLWPIMVNQHGQTLYECYQSEARYVTGSNQPHVLWNKIGRQRILKCIKSQL